MQRDSTGRIADASIQLDAPSRGIGPGPKSERPLAPSGVVRRRAMQGRTWNPTNRLVLRYGRVRPVCRRDIDKRGLAIMVRGTSRTRAKTTSPVFSRSTAAVPVGLPRQAPIVPRSRTVRTPRMPG